MLDFNIVTNKNGQPVLQTSINGKALLSISQLNKGTAFSAEERAVFGLLGKLPHHIETLQQQVNRAYQQYLSYDEQLNRNILLNHLLNQNEILFYKLVQEHLEEMLPTIYTPIVGAAVKSFNKKYTRPRGLYISYEDQDDIGVILDNRTNPEVDLIVVSDGEGVLGIGDQGVGAMAIPVAKLMVYTAFGGINPRRTLPIMLDAGTNNETLLNDPLYLGWRHKRIEGKPYDQFIEKFVNAVKERFPKVFLHWEDFGKRNAYHNLDQYQDTLCSFNDDIQGTGVVAVAALLSAMRKTKQTLAEQRIVVFGSGSAGVGVANAIHQSMMHQGLSSEEAYQRFWLIERKGLVTDKSETITEAQRPFARKHSEASDWELREDGTISLHDVVKNTKASVLIGTSAAPGAFDQAFIQEMAAQVEHPIIFPLSNPPERCEATPADLINYTEGRAIIATGSPFDNYDYQGKTYRFSQCNNYLAFPGIGLGVLSVKAKHVSAGMLAAASHALSQYQGMHDDLLLPTITQAQEASRQVAIAVAEQAIAEGLEGIEVTQPVAELVDANYWEPHYLPYERVD